MCCEGCHRCVVSGRVMECEMQPAEERSMSGHELEILLLLQMEKPFKHATHKRGGSGAVYSEHSLVLTYLPSSVKRAYQHCPEPASWSCSRASSTPPTVYSMACVQPFQQRVHKHISIPLHHTAVEHSRAHNRRTPLNRTQ